jgi:preprotein translocase SecE subunit
VSEVRSELKRVTWPSPSELRATTVLVIVTSIVMGCMSGAARSLRALDSAAVGRVAKQAQLTSLTSRRRGEATTIRQGFPAMARIMCKNPTVSRDHQNGRHHNYSYVDVLERVADGVHVDIVAREPKGRSSGKTSEWQRPHQDESSRSTRRRQESRRPASSKD